MVDTGNVLEWYKRYSRCPLAAEGFEPYHKWQPVSTVKTSGSESVMMLMCGICFCELSLSEINKHRDAIHETPDTV